MHILIDGTRRAGRAVAQALAVPVAIVAVANLVSCARNEGTPKAATESAPSSTRAAAPCSGDNGGLTLPAGFCATIFADTLGHARHVVVAPDGVVYVNTWSSPYYPKGSTPNAPFLVALRDTSADGRADLIVRFGSSPSTGGTGGTGIGLHGGALYAEEGPRIVRYARPATGIVPTASAEVIVSGLPVTGDHSMHPFAIDTSGSMYINLGSASNSCQIKNRTLESRGHKVCTELKTRGGIWMYSANNPGQTFSPAGRYATGIRNAVGIAIGPGGVYSTQHGRDQLAENWPKLYTPEQGQNLPGEELLKIERDADYGWPSCYFDDIQKKLVLAPEFGGNGGNAVGGCASKRAPIAYFPAHWAPDGLLFYSGSQFPAKYRSGAFITFHGSWNRAPGPQGGYNVVFLPFSGATPASPNGFEIFADGFAGGKMQPDAAEHRPVGLAQGPDGSIYVTDDQRGRVWRITYRSGKTP